MLKLLKTFKGGVHPPQLKNTATCATREIPLPPQLIVSMSQHMGVEATPLVQKGDLVKKGQLIGSFPEGKIGANVHAPTSGKVLEVALKPHPDGKNITAVVIEPDGQETWDESVVPCENPLALTKEELIDKIKEAGIVGMGGAAFPTHIKLAPPPEHKIDTLLINGVECEPALTSDHRLMLEHSREIALGIQIMAKILGNSRTVLAIEANKPDAATAMEQVCTPLGIEVVLVPVKYPQGAEKQLIKVVTGREVPMKSRISSIGLVERNVGTAFAVFEACYLGRPLIRRITTISGPCIKNPANLWVAVGTPVSYLIEQCGGYSQEAALLIHGGPMMGAAVSSDEIPIVKGSSGITVFPAKDVKPDTYGPCIRCGRCVTACPHGQIPFQVALAMEQKKYDLDLINDFVDNDFECVECGSCTYACPSKRPLVQFIRQAKAFSKSRRQKR